MKQKTAVIMALVFTVMLLCSGITASANGWEEAFSSVLDSLETEKPTDAENPALEYSYLLYDIDKDGIPELVTKTGTCEADYTGTVYTCKSEEAVKAGEFGLGHAGLFTDPGKNGVIVWWGHMGAAGGVRYSLSDGQISSEQIFEETLDIQNDPEAEYTPIEEYVAGTKPLSLYDVSLRLPFDIYAEILESLAGVAA